MNSEIKQIDQMLSRMDNNTVAVSHEHNADLPPGIDEYFEETALSLETEDEMVTYRNNFLDASIRHDRDMNEIKARLTTLEAMMRSDDK